jgi:hypothetical protein
MGWRKRGKAASLARVEALDLVMAEAIIIIYINAVILFQDAFEMQGNPLTVISLLIVIVDSEI